MDSRTAAIIANTEDMAKRCETAAMVLDRIYEACEYRAITPRECRELLRITSEALRCAHQRDSLTLALFAPEVLTALEADAAAPLVPPVAEVSPVAPPVPPVVVERVPWWRRWLRRIVG